MTIGRTIEQARKARGWTLGELGRRSGIPLGSVFSVEAGDNCQLKTLAAIARGFGMKTSGLLALAESGDEGD